MAYTQFSNPVRPVELSQAQVDLLIDVSGPWGLLYLNGDKDQFEIIRRNGTKSGIMTFADHVDREDVWVDQTYDGGNVNIRPSILGAIIAGAEAIMVKDPSDSDAITIASGDSVRRIVGKDADTTIVPVDITCNKDDVTFEQLGLSSKTLALSGDDNTARGLLLSSTAKLELTVANTGQLIEGCRFDGITDSYALRLAAVSDSGISIANCRFVDGSSTNDITKVTSAALGGLTIINTVFSHVNTKNSAYTVDLSSGNTNATTVSNCQFITTTNGGFKINGSDNRITSCAFATGGAAGSNLSMSSPTGTDIDSVVSHCTFASTNSAHVLFECTSADGDAAGLVLMGNSFRTGTILGSQDAVWIGNNMAGCIINFQSKTGIVVIGGDMTGATLQNINADIVFRDVKGQGDQGDYIPVDGGPSLGANATRFANLWLSGNADIEGTLQVDGNITTGGTVDGVDIAARDDAAIIQARAYHASAQDMTTGLIQVVALDSERWDNDTMHDASTNNERLTATTAGTYLIEGHIEWEANTTGRRILYLYFNGVIRKFEEKLPIATATTQQISDVFQMAATDYVNLAIFQNSGGNLNILSTAWRTPELTMTRIGAF